MTEIAEKQVEGKPHWIMGIQDIPTTQGPSYPVFEWSFGFENGMRGGELRAWPSHGGMLVLENRRGPINMPKGGWKFKTVQEALVKINECGWSKPPYINDVFQDIIDLQKKFPTGSKEEAEGIFKELRQKWERLAAS